MKGVVGGKKKECHFNSWLMLLTILAAATFASASKCKGGDNYKGECFNEEEWAMESDVAQRVLIGLVPHKYITYPAVQGRASCNNPKGMPYSQGKGCLPNAVRPQSSGCLMIHQCRS